MAFELKHPQTRELLGGDLLAQCLHNQGVRTLFGLHGGHLDAFLMGAHEIGIQMIDTRHETVAVQAAEGYSRVTNKPGVCFITANSGFCNGLPGLATAFADRNPVFCITSSPPLRDAETNCLQGFHDQVVVAKPITKFAHRITNAEEIPRIVAYGLRVATSGAPGPVLLDFPIDVLFTPVSASKIAWGAIDRPLPYPPGPSIDGIAKAVMLWKAAKRPCVISGTGAKSASAGEELARLAKATHTPVFSIQKHSASLPFEHPMRAGVATQLAALERIGKQAPDFILLLGARTGFLLGGRGGAVIPNENCTLVQVDVDGGEIGKSHPIDVGIISDATLALAAFNTAVHQERFSAQGEWIQTALGLKSARSPNEDQPKLIEGRSHPYHAVKAVYDALEPGAIVCIDGGEAGGWATQLLEHARYSKAMVTTGYLGFLGNGFGYALGAAVGNPGRQVVNMHGDGSAGFHIGELDTYAKFNLKILTVIINNYVWGMSQSGQELLYGKMTMARPATALNPGTKYETVAEGFGCGGERADNLDEIAPAVKKLVGRGGPGVLNLIVADKPIHSSTLSMVDNSEDPHTIVVPYYDNLPRPYYKGKWATEKGASNGPAAHAEEGVKEGVKEGTEEKAEERVTGADHAHIHGDPP